MPDYLMKCPWTVRVLFVSALIGATVAVIALGAWLLWPEVHECRTHGFVALGIRVHAVRI